MNEESQEVPSSSEENPKSEYSFPEARRVVTDMVFGPHGPSIKDYQEVQAKADDAENRATIDSLTGLLNKGALFQALDEKVALATRDVGLPAFFMFDLDKFKSVNDEYGHDIGDQLLVRVGEMLKRILRKEDLAGRFGGDEFGILVDLTPKKEAGEETPWQVLQIIESKISGGMKELNVGASYGASIWRKKEDGTPLTAQEMFKEADKNLYDVKEKKPGSR